MCRIAFAFSIGWLAACASGSGAVKSDRRSDQRIDELRAQNRAQRSKIRDLENQIFLLRDRLETAQVATGRVGDQAPRLPVEVREPDSSGASSASGASKPGYQVVGVDSQGNEIVYVGDAAKDDVMRPSLSNTHTTVDDPPRRGRRPVVGHVPVTSDRISAGGPRHLPTVQNQLRRARNRGQTAPEPPGAGAQQEYQRYYAALRAGKHSEAIAGFRQFVRRYPDHDYADNAQYWLGEAYYDQKQYHRARIEFRKVITAYPKGNKLPDALLKLGFCYLSLNEIPKARAVLRQVATIYPRTRAAEIASARLDALE